MTTPRCFQASTSSSRGHSHSKPSSHCIVACDMTRPTTIFSTLLPPSKTSPSAIGMPSVAAATAERRAEGHSEEKDQGEGVCVEGDADPPGPQSSQHRASHFSPTLFPCLPPPVPVIRVPVRAIVGGLMCCFVPVVRVAVKVPSQFRVQHRRRAL